MFPWAAAKKAEEYYVKHNFSSRLEIWDSSITYSKKVLTKWWIKMCIYFLWISLWTCIESVMHTQTLVIQDIAHQRTACKHHGFPLKEETGSLPLIPKLLRPHSVGCLSSFSPHQKLESPPFLHVPCLSTDRGLHIEKKGISSSF